MTTLPAIVDAVLNDLDDLLLQLPVDDYAQPLAVFSGSSMGQHVRHVLEFFQCVAAGSVTGEVDYDARQRDYQLENSPPYARLTLQRLKLALSQLDPQQPLWLRQRYTPDSPLMVRTNVNRELVYNIEHAIHHMALLRIGVQLHYPGVRLPRHFGVAYSTLIHQQTA